MEEESEVPSAISTISLAEFLESAPPNQEFQVADLSVWKPAGVGRPAAGSVLNTPDIQLHCTDEACNGLRFFRSVSPLMELKDSVPRLPYLIYRCSNCRRTTKVFSFHISKEDAGYGKCYKYGEHPSFGPPTPDRLIKLIGPDRELFLKGRRCENQGLGIGAFVYYSRVVENQKNRIISEIIKVATKLKTGADAVSELEAAIKETQFSKALKGVKHGIPPSLLIDGHNPLLLLHAALSEGLHDCNDQECLEIASSVRVILMELAERLSQALKDEAELNHALSKLLSIRDGGG